jgi:hypothetical protein
MTKRRHERISRHATVIAASSLGQIESEPPRPGDAGMRDDRADGLRRWRSDEGEALSRQYHGCLQIGEPPLLSHAEIERVRQKMAGYGHTDK